MKNGASAKEFRSKKTGERRVDEERSGESRKGGSKSEKSHFQESKNPDVQGLGISHVAGWFFGCLVPAYTLLLLTDS